MTVFHPRAGTHAALVAEGATLVAGTLVGTNAAGYAVAWTGGTSTDRFWGIAQQTVTGDVSENIVVRLDTSGPTAASVPVTGASSVAVVNSLVYAGGEDIGSDLTLTPTTAPAVGRLVYWRSATDCDVEFFTPAEHEAKV